MKNVSSRLHKKNEQWYFFSVVRSQSCLNVRYCAPSNTRFFEPTPLVNQNKSSIGSAVFSARCNIYISRLCYDASVRLCVCPSVCNGSALAHYN